MVRWPSLGIFFDNLGSSGFNSSTLNSVIVLLAILVERLLVGHVRPIISKPLLGLLPRQLQMLWLFCHFGH